jgi:hypothetical protein
MTIWRMRIACWIPKATNTHSEYVILTLLFHHNNGCPNAPQCYVIRAVPVFLAIYIYYCTNSQHIFQASFNIIPSTSISVSRSIFFGYFGTHFILCHLKPKTTYWRAKSVTLTVESLKQNWSTFLSNALRCPKQRSFVEDSQASGVCPSCKGNT